MFSGYDFIIYIFTRVNGRNRPCIGRRSLFARGALFSTCAQSTEMYNFIIVIVIVIRYTVSIYNITQYIIIFATT